ncbi:MAG: C25 family cysteine peptidase [Bacteroidales bacterium]|nr:C25 family cysteine peptidase [Bacteroidales bacterium]
MTKQLLIIAMCMLLPSSILAQEKVKIDLRNTLSSSTIKNYQQKSNGLRFEETITYIELQEQQTKKGSFLHLSSDKTLRSYNVGKPQLPVITKLIEAPLNTVAKVKIINYTEEIITLSDYNLEKQILPAQPSVSKSDDPQNLPFYKDKQVYKQNSFYKEEIVKVEDKGYMRDKHIVYIEVSPFQYNPVSNTIKVLNNIEYEIQFTVSPNPISIKPSVLQSPFFDNILPTVNKSQKTIGGMTGPIKYVIVSHRMFENSLQPFIKWKISKGFKVVVAYTDDPNVGNTTTSIKAYLKNLYENPQDNIAPTFALLVGDVQQIPSFSGTTGTHVTDLYYFEYTNDKLPEVFYGRFSATSVAELQPQIDKTLEVEKYQMPNSSYLDNVVLVAGVDANFAPQWGNGFVNYSNQYYTNTNNGINSYFYLYNDNSGVMDSSDPAAAASIRSYINAGVSIANYTAHCNSSGWGNPQFFNNHVSSMTNANKYPLMIGNCCLSNKFNDNSCFGETLLRAANKGAVGYIGASNNSLWNEDYYWGVGLASISANPTYQNSGLGSYDRFFHLNGEAKDDWYTTQGQIFVAGNLAVEASSSSKKAYYWEIYHLMGDPSLCPYVKIPEVINAVFDSQINLNATNFQVQCEADAYVAISQNGVLLDAKFAPNTGNVELSFDEISTTDSVKLVITKQNKQPKTTIIPVINPTYPYIYVRNVIVCDSLSNNDGEISCGESIYLRLEIQNSSDFNATNAIAAISTSDTNVIIVDSLENIGVVNKQNYLTVESAFRINFGSYFTNQQEVLFNINLSWEDSTSNNYQKAKNYTVRVKAPELRINNFSINDSTGNNDGVLDSGENAKFVIEVENFGADPIQGVFGEIVSITGNNNITISNSTSSTVNLGVNQTQSLMFNVSLSSQQSQQDSISINFRVRENTFNFYTAERTMQTVLCKQSSHLISETGNYSVPNKGILFFDSGGESQNYDNNEDYTVSFTPQDNSKKLTVNFLNFNLESHSSCSYDYLSVYDSTVVDASKLIGKYCGSNSPGVLKATNTLGALTFVFHSDYSVTKNGWKAEIIPTNKGAFNVSFNITDTEENPIQNANIRINSKSAITNNNGNAYVYSIDPSDAINYTITKEGYEDVNGSLNINNEDVSVQIQMLLAATGSIDKTKTQEFKVYPNPNNGVFSIEFFDQSYNKDYVVKIYNSLGTLVYSNKIQKKQLHTVDISDNPQGTYILIIESENKNIVNRYLIVK